MRAVVSPSDPSRPGSVVVQSLEQRAQMLWPRLDSSALGRCEHDAGRIVELVVRRTSLPWNYVVDRLMASSVSEDEAAMWFG